RKRKEPTLPSRPGCRESTTSTASSTVSFQIPLWIVFARLRIIGMDLQILHQCPALVLRQFRTDDARGGRPTRSAPAAVARAKFVTDIQIARNRGVIPEALIHQLV